MTYLQKALTVSTVSLHGDAGDARPKRDCTGTTDYQSLCATIPSVEKRIMKCAGNKKKRKLRTKRIAERCSVNIEFIRAALGYHDLMSWFGQPMLYDGGLCVNRTLEDHVEHNKHPNSRLMV
jgi:hypothetical protein